MKAEVDELKDNELAMMDVDGLARQLNFLGARDRLHDVVTMTRLIPSVTFSNRTGAEVYIKPENLQRTGAFKIRGAYNKIAKLSEAEKAKGLITASAGNHAQGVAYAAQAMDAKAIIVMPTTTPLIKIERTKSYGAEVVLAGNCYDQAYMAAVRMAEENDYVFVHPFNDLDVIEGQGTIAIEILDELRDCDVIFCPIGGGGLISGVAVCAKMINPQIKIIGVEPEGAASMVCSIRDGHVTCLDEVSTIADGAAVAEPGSYNYELVNTYVDEIVTVSDFEIMKAFIDVLEGHKLIGESAGLLSIAALSKLDLQGQKVVCILSGGNIDVLTVSSMVNKGLVANSRILKFAVELPDRPGELLAVAKILAEVHANVVEVQHDQFKVMDRFMNVMLEVTVETNGREHIDLITNKLSEAGYTVHIIY